MHAGFHMWVLSNQKGSQLSSLTEDGTDGPLVSLSPNLNPPDDAVLPVQVICTSAADFFLSKYSPRDFCSDYFSLYFPSARKQAQACIDTHQSVLLDSISL